MSRSHHLAGALAALVALTALAAEPEPKATSKASALTTSQMRAGIVSKLSYDHEYFTGVAKLAASGKSDAKLSRDDWAKEVVRAKSNIPILNVFFGERADFEKGKPLSMPPRDVQHRVYANLIGLLNMLQAYDKGDFEKVLSFGERIVVAAKTDLGVVRGEDAKYYLDLYREYFWFMAAAHYRLGHDREAIAWLTRIDSDANVQALKAELAKIDTHSPSERLQQLYSRPIALLPLSNLAPAEETKWIGPGFAEVFTTDLQRYTNLTVMERANVDKVAKEVALSQVGVTDEKNAKKLATQLAAGSLIAGGFRVQGDEVHLTLDLLDGDSGRSLAHAEGKAKKDSVFVGGREVLLALLRDAGWLSEDTANDLRAARAPAPDTIKALLEARLLLASKSDQAKALYEKAVKDSPEYAKAFDDIKAQFKGVNPLVAVMPFANVTGKEEDAWIAIGTTEALNTDLPNIGFTLVERTQLGKLLKEEDVGQVLGEAKSHELAKKLGADFLVLGSVMHPSRQVRVDCRFVDVGTGVVVQTFSEEGKEDELTFVLGRLSAVIARRFNTKLSEEELKKLSGNRLSKDEFERIARQQLLESQLVKKQVKEEQRAESRLPTFVAMGGVVAGALLAGTSVVLATQSSATTAYIEGLQKLPTTEANAQQLESTRQASGATTTAWTAAGFAGVGLAAGSAAYLAWQQLKSPEGAPTSLGVKPAAQASAPGPTLAPTVAAGGGQVAVGVSGTF